MNNEQALPKQNFNIDCFCLINVIGNCVKLGPHLFLTFFSTGRERETDYITVH